MKSASEILANFEDYTQQLADAGFYTELGNCLQKGFRDLDRQRQERMVSLNAAYIANGHRQVTI